MSLIFNMTALLLIVLIIWWFWLYKEKATSTNEALIPIIVENGVYSPSHIKVSQSTITLAFTRKDASPCSEFVIFDKLDIHERLPLNTTKKIVLQNLKPGEYKFACQMNMYQGMLTVTFNSLDQ